MLTSLSGDWTILSEKEMNYTKTTRLPLDLFNKLEERKLIITQNNHQKIYEAYHEWHQYKYNRSTPLHIINITDNCNLQCTYCSASVGNDNKKFEEKNMTIDTAKKIVDFIFDAANIEQDNDKIHIEFQGGEILLNFQILKSIVEYAKEKNNRQYKLIFGTTSNLIALKQKHCDFLKKNKISIATSIDGPKFIHDQQRVFPDQSGSLGKLADSLELLEKNNIKFGLLAVITSLSKEYYRQIIDMFESFGIYDLALNYIRPFGNAKLKWDNLGLTINERLDNYKKLLDYLVLKWEKGNFIVERLFRLTLDKITNSRDVGFTDYRNPCGMIKGQIGYDIKGNIYTCYPGRKFEKYKVGNVFRNNYKEITKSENATRLISESIPSYPECQKCAYQSYCGICPVWNYVDGIDHTTSKNDPSCQISQFLLDYTFSLIMKKEYLIKAYMLNKNQEKFKLGSERSTSC
ncbi:MAG: radical SAM protein [bacterium]